MTIKGKTGSYHFGPNDSPHVIFPASQKFGDKLYKQSLVNPSLVNKCTEATAKERAAQIRKEGWAARIVAFKTPIGTAYIVYERRTGREMSKSQKALAEKLYGR